MRTTKISVLDDSGKRLGRDYDYEYGGGRHEAGRAGHPQRLRVWCLGASAVVLALGLWPVIGTLLGVCTFSNGMTDPLLLLGLCAIFAGLICLGLRSSLKRRNRLYAALSAASPPDGGNRAVF